MNPEDWDRAPRSTNGVVCANCSARGGGHKPSLYVAMQSLYMYEKDRCLLSSTVALSLRMDLKLHTGVQLMKSNAHKPW